MKKIFIALFCFIVVAITCIYIFIPSTLTVSNVVLIHFTSTGANRFLMDKAGWQKWLPGSSQNINNDTDSTLTYDGTEFILSGRFYNAAEIGIVKNSNRYNSRLTLIPILNDSVAIQWETTITGGANPVSRLIAYIRGKRLKNSMSQVLEAAKKFLEDTKSVYGFPIRNSTLKDTAVIALKFFSKEYPGTDTLYKKIYLLQQYISSSHATQVDFPMLNVSGKDTTGYDVMVGVPVSRDLEGSGAFIPRHLVPIPDKILTTEVTGGPYTINRAFNQVETYMTDHQLRAPVIPFFYLVTDRSKEKDTARWVTKIVYPII